MSAKPLLTHQAGDTVTSNAEVASMELPVHTR
jgi:hypothetical protein